MRCPSCQSNASRVVDSRPGPDGASIRRRRECEECAGRFTTYERVEVTLPMIVKRDGRREAFDEAKVRRALRTATRKRSVPADRLEAIVHRVAAELASTGEREVSSETLGRALLRELKGVDEVSYARFASVFLRFERLDDFASLAQRDAE